MPPKTKRRTIKEGRRRPVDAKMIANERGEMLLQEAAITEAFDVLYDHESQAIVNDITAAFDPLYDHGTLMMDETAAEALLSTGVEFFCGLLTRTCYTPPRPRSNRLNLLQIRDAASFADACCHMRLRRSFQAWRWNNAKSLFPAMLTRNRLQREDEPRIKKRKAKRASPTCSIQSIIAAIMAQEESTPSSPRHIPSDDRELALLLDLSPPAPGSAVHSSPRMKAKAMGVKILKSRPLAPCAVSPRHTRGAARVWNITRAQPRAQYGF